MKPLLLYLLQLITASGILYGYYHFFLRNKKFHQYNRYYLLMATVVSILIPFLQIPVYFTETDAESSLVIKTLKTIYYSGFEDEVVINAAANGSHLFDWNVLFYSLYLAIAVVLFIRILVSLKKINNIIKRHTAEELNGIHFVNTTEPGTPYSFFRWLFWNRKIELESDKGQQIFRHEIFHIQQKHSWDVIFMEVVKMIFWINPFFHLVKKEIRAIHEFLADQFAVKEEEKWSYAELLLMQALNTKQNIANPFFHNQIKRRIAMITNPQKTSHRYLRKLLVLPLIVFVVTLVAFTYKNKTNTKIILSDPMTVIIDPGHGGTAPGAQSPDKKYSESQLALELAKTIKRLSSEYNIGVLLTREDENFPANATTVSESLKKRVDITKEAKAELFVSLHMSSAGNEMQTHHSGFGAFISSKGKDMQNQQLASAILQSLSAIYKTDPIVKTRNDVGIYVLDGNVCPAVLLECGYINNNQDLSFITDKDNQEKVARKILEALVHYKKSETRNDVKENINLVLNDTVLTSQHIRVENGTSIQSKPRQVQNIPLRLTEITKDSLGEPLIVIDNKKYPNLKSLKDIDNIIQLSDIYAINVLKGNSAIAKYGDDGKHGVIEIITRKNAGDKKPEEIIVEGVKLNDKNIVFDKVETEASFKGGFTGWKKFLERNLNANIGIENKAPKGNYTVIVQFIVNSDGSISEVKPLTQHGYGMEDEAVRIIKKGPAWIPATQNGRAVNSYRKQPVTFVVAGNDMSINEPKNPVEEEIVVVGYPTVRVKKDNSYSTKEDIEPAKLQLKEVVVDGYKKEEEVVVTGHKKIEEEKKDNSYSTKEDIEKLSPIYPNPTNNNITIPYSSSVASDGEVRILDMNGNVKMVTKTSFVKGLNNLNVNVSSLTNGTYIIQVTNGDKKAVRFYKLAKQ